MERTLVIAPHPDDETLGVGGTVFRHISEGKSVAWLIVTSVDSTDGAKKELLATQKTKINTISDLYSFSEVFELGFPTTKLDVTPISEMVQEFSKVILDFKPNEIFLPHWGDVHSDHGFVFKSAISSLKWFRNPSVNRILAYETLSETSFGLVPNEKFVPNTYVDISRFLEQKIAAMKVYESELGEHPFPRSEDAIRSLAVIRGAESGYRYAESFQLLLNRA